MTNIRNNFSILFRENAGLIFVRLTAKKAVPIFRRILRRQKSAPRSGALKVVFVYSAGRMAARNAYAE